jgi:hypothetical protein|nr:MAG TPA: integral membrane protein [Caudoviricetes sp.]
MKVLLLIIIAVALVFIAEDVCRIREMQEIETLSRIVRETNDTTVLNKADSILQIRMKAL